MANPTRGGVSGVSLAPLAYSLSYGTAGYGSVRGQGTGWFGPSAPMAPSAPPEVAGRRYDYPVGFNLNVTARAYEAVSFDQLRRLADGYDLLRLVIETRKDQAARMKWAIRPRDGKKGQDAKAKALTAFFRKPDGINAWTDWLRMGLEDLLVIDAFTLFKQRDRSGNLLALEPVDGATIKPILGDDGRLPHVMLQGGATVWPEAYQQILKGLPAVNYTARDLLYRPRNVRTNRVYGYSPVEQVMTTVNIALRRQVMTLEYFTSGSVPDALIGVPETWTPDQITTYQRYWDSLFTDNLAERRRARFVPGKVALHQTSEPQLKGEFDEWLSRIVCFAFSTSPQALIKQMNRASADTQKELAEEEGLAPLLDWIKTTVDGVLEDDFGAADHEFAWVEEQHLDAAKQSEILKGQTSGGLRTLNEGRADLGLDPDPSPAADMLMVLTGSGLVPIDANTLDGKRAALDAFGPPPAPGGGSPFGASQDDDQAHNPGATGDPTAEKAAGGLGSPRVQKMDAQEQVRHVLAAEVRSLDFDPITQDPEDKVRIQQILESVEKTDLSHRERRIVEMIYYDEMTLREIAKIEELSHQTISSIHHRALRVLRRQVERDSSPDSTRLPLEKAPVRVAHDAAAGTVAKFDDSQPRADDGKWTSGGGGSGGSSKADGGDAEAKEQKAFRRTVLKTVAGGAVIAGGAIVTALSGGTAPVAVAAAVFIAENYLLADALTEAGRHIGKHLGYGDEEIAAILDHLSKEVGFGKAAKGGDMTRLRARLASTVDVALDAMIAHVEDDDTVPEDRADAVLDALEEVRDRFKAKIAALDAPADKAARAPFTKRRTGRPADPVPFVRPATRRAMKAIAGRVAEALSRTGRGVADLIRGLGKLAKASPDPDPDDQSERYRRETDDLLEGFDFSDLQDIAPDVADDLGRVATDTVRRSVAQVGADDRDGLVNQVNTRAVAAARARAAEMVGMRFDAEGNLVPSRNAEMAITDSTREMLRETIASGLERNIGLDAIADEIEASYGFSAERAARIAEYEVAQVNGLASLDTYDGAAEAGVAVKKAWWAEPGCCAICQENADAGAIDLDAEFPSGDDATPAHPSCRCVVVPVVGE